MGRRGWVWCVAVALMGLVSSAVAEQREAVAPVRHTTAIAYQKAFRNAGIDAWRARVPEVGVMEVRSTVDGETQRALWYDSGSSRKKPLLVVLHSWGADYTQNIDIPFAELAIRNDWAMVHPDFRGPNVRPEATASEAAVQDVLDAVDAARARAAIDDTRIYLVGYSGGGMKAMILAGKHPDRWAGVAVWGGIYDIPDWYRHRGKEAEYDRQIAASCGGPPRPGTAAEAECRTRSPSAYLAQAAGRVPILIAHGLRDGTVPPRHALHAFEALAEPGDRFTDQQRAHIDGRHRVPKELRQPGGWNDPLEPLFARARTPVRLLRRSRTATLVLYDGAHDMVYNATAQWLADQRRTGLAAAM